ncbi:MAG TPA: hypothetical protein VFS37_03055, partial [Conexibacter sp.]|nr:hypothetical protein [Conexibacter sp.]
ALQGRRSVQCFFRDMLEGIETHGGEGVIGRPQVVRSARMRHAAETRYEIRTDSKIGLVSVFADRVLMQTGRVISVLATAEVHTPVDAELYERILARIRSRMRRTGQTEGS